MGIQVKQFYRLKDTKKLFKKIIPNLTHKADGLILQLNKKYKADIINYILKWKPKNFNSIDFLFRLKKKKNFKLKSYALILTINDKKFKKIYNELLFLKKENVSNLENRIIECTLEK